MKNQKLEILKNDRIEFLQLSRSRKIEILKNSIKNSNGITSQRVEMQLDKFCKFLRKSLARDYTYGSQISFESILFPELKENHINRKNLIYRNYANISGKR